MRCLACNTRLLYVPDPLDKENDCLCSTCRDIIRDPYPLREYQHQYITEGIREIINYNNDID